jgi:hypothetical protein
MIGAGRLLRGRLQEAGFTFGSAGRLCRLAAVLSLSASILLPYSTPAHSQSMSIPGQFAVSSTGAATYNIPISLPPGTAGMAPTLSLEYSSQGPNGLLGVGWTLGGLPSINRCPRTLVQDGFSGGVNYDANDRFCLEGQRLVVTSGSYGADGAQYRTEIDGYSEIISHGTAGTGPAWFEVHTKSGQVMEFGHNSQILVPGKPTAQLWTVDKVSDSAGNYFTVSYTVNPPNGQYYPVEIDYTGNAAASLSPYNKVLFGYASRPDITPQYQGGSRSQTTVRLTDVGTYVGTTLVADYHLAYSLSTTTSRSELTSVTICDGGGSNCLPATTFTWQFSANGTDIDYGDLANADGSYVGWRASFGDFNGDGRTDVLWDYQGTYADGRSSGNRNLWLSNGDGTFSIVSNLAGKNGSYVGWRATLGDFNGDGKADILWDNESGFADGRSSGNRNIWFGNGDGTFTIVANIAGKDGSYVGWRALLGDFNGDGKTDILWDEEGASSRSSGERDLWLGDGTGSFSITTNVAGENGAYVQWHPSFGDFNGDGKTDILWDYQSTYTDGRSSGSRDLWLSNGDGTFAIVSNLAGLNGSYIGWRATLADFNGDGKTDILWDYEATYSDGLSSGNRDLWLGQGDGTFSTVSNLAGLNGSYVGWRPILADFNGDGKTDILWDYENAYTDGRSDGSRDVWYGNGDGTFTILNNLAGLNTHYVGWRPMLGDFNGDGKADIFWDSPDADDRSAGDRHLWLSNNIAQDSVSQLTNGLGATTVIFYQSLSQGIVYTKDNSAVYPTQDMQGPFNVVSNAYMSNGIGGDFSFNYAYAGAKLDLSGRGFLGFRQMSSTDPQTNIMQTTTYRQGFPYIGLPVTTGKYFGVMQNQTTNSYQFTNASGAASISVPSVSSAPYQTSISQSVTQSTDLDGTVLPTVTTTYQYDAFGNPTQVQVATPDGFSKTTVNTYTNDATHWYLGRLTGATVTSVTP